MTNKVPNIIVNHADALNEYQTNLTCASLSEISDSGSPMVVYEKIHLKAYRDLNKEYICLKQKLSISVAAYVKRKIPT